MSIDKKRTVSVDAVRFTPGFGEVLPTSVSGFTAWVANVFQKVPAQYRDSATVEINAYENYGEPTFAIAIRYRRLETDEEVAERLEEEDDHDWALYEKLKARFEK